MGRKYQSPYKFFGLVSFFLIVGIAIILSQQNIQPVVVYFLSVSITTFLMYGYDKFIADTDKTRVPEWVLHFLAIIGGSIAALIAQKSLRHKTIKGSFQGVFWGIVVAQGIIIWLVTNN